MRQDLLALSLAFFSSFTNGDSESVDYPVTPTAASRPRGMTAIGVFLLFGAVMALFAGGSLMRPGTGLDRMWVLNPQAHNQLAPIGKPVGLLFLCLSVALAFAGTGWLKRRQWGWQLAVVSSELKSWGTSQTYSLAALFKERSASP